VTFLRLLAALRRGDSLPAGPAGSAPGAVAGAGRRDDDLPLTPRSSLAEFAAVVPGLREEMAERARVAGLIVAWMAVLMVPAWTVVDQITSPAQAGVFLAVRLGCDVPMAAALWALWRHPVGRRWPEWLTFFVLAVVQTEVAWMIPRATDPQYYLLGFTLAIYGSGCIMVARPRWTAALIGYTWAVLGICALTAPEGLAAREVVAAAVFVGTASVIALMAHMRRYALNIRELLTRGRLEREQHRTRALLRQLERLSHEDPLTGLANRRRWDAELNAVCRDAREQDEIVSVLLLDLDHFKHINDRHGHAGGDLVLREVSDLLSAAVRSTDLVARLGGDELAILLPGASAERAVGLAEQLRTATAGLELPGFLPGELTLSVGVATTAGAEAYPLELMSQADERLYRAKITRNAVAAENRSAQPALSGGPGAPGAGRRS
jgi:diguanylate cyclase (GGDEF)-like protein